ncbi:MAG: protein-glutamate O-methyltransferase CheR [Pseudomonadales bacterium]|nr:protein-glutamate O-methyltransferase CheR [Pseudomonadales bacterium]
MSAQDKVTSVPDLDLEVLEIHLLLTAIEQRYGYDFFNYAMSSLKRRVRNIQCDENLSSISELVPKILHDPQMFDRFLVEMSVTVTRMFRNPQIFKRIKESLLPKLHTYPRIKIWHAGCATGEEVYSMAILLAEADLLKKTHIYATDYNNQSLAIAEKGIYPLEKMQDFSKNYLAAGGQCSFADYYHAKYEHAVMASILSKNITFAHHNLMRDQSFGEMNIIFCRNVLIYFDQILQDKVLTMMRDSLIHRGYLVLGDRETISFTGISESFTEIEPRSRIYQKQPEISGF